MPKLTEYTAASRFNSGDIIIKDGVSGTRKITVANAASEFAGLISAVNHRNVFRGKSLGSSITETQKAAISDGTFDDMFIGDYWLINDIKWTIADMDYWYRQGDGDNVFDRHHILIVPHTQLYSASMNATNTVEGGYVGSQMYISGLDQAKTTFTNVFGDMLLTHREFLVNGVTNGEPTSTAWFDSTVELMNEVMVCGTVLKSPTGVGRNSKQQLSLFRLNPTTIGRQTIWLRDIVPPSSFLSLNASGITNGTSPSTTVGVRPVAAIG